MEIPLSDNIKLVYKADSVVGKAIVLGKFKRIFKELVEFVETTETAHCSICFTSMHENKLTSHMNTLHKESATQ